MHSDHRELGWAWWLLQPSKGPRFILTMTESVLLHRSLLAAGDGRAEDPGPVIQEVSRAAVPGAPQPLTSPPGLRLVTLYGLFPSWKRDSRVHFPGPQTLMAKSGKGLIMISFCGWLSQMHSSLHQCPPTPGKAANQGKCTPFKEGRNK